MGGEVEWESGISRCKLLYVEWIKKGPSIENYIQYLLINLNGKEKMDQVINTEVNVCLPSSHDRQRSTQII